MFFIAIVKYVDRMTTDEHFATNSINEQVANFMTLFRCILPDL